MPGLAGRSLAVHKELQLVFCAAHIGCVDVLAANTGELVTRLVGLADSIVGVVTDNDSLVAAADEAGNVAVWNCRSGRRLWRALLPCTPSMLAMATNVKRDQMLSSVVRKS